MSAPGHFDRLQADHPKSVIEVQMGEVKVASFQEKLAIGTRHLAGCSVILIASVHDPLAGDKNAAAMTDRVTELPTDTVIVCAMFGGTVALRDQGRIMHSKFLDWPGQGTVVALGSTGSAVMGGVNGDRALIFVEDKKYVSGSPS
ncbi:hypothetical protein BO94DRAFT_560544 [Aspergillus sclerotioniger CBS 115572]|uniref:Uncharacterized protein n=1 Tax=Aspergillus sclerotioniger CBS 115572 TaxID=1450535 RepID=A0A317VD07_9EURO|nr:hypothetical protein BO94DRAFT_560544 [Aspergillus sclerotioniger CBS 115572]PWY70888.1 hypothetical protein BO94DRAFT_560544 [Aspergillus sclerotioniger CBS 115572]